jgi:thiol-disulfide isomerase/thioredoxin
MLLTLGAVSCSRNRGAAPEAATATASEQEGSEAIELLRDPALVGDFSTTDLEGRPVSMASLRGKVVLVNFWATWCPPCRAEIPDLIALQNRYRDRLVILGISEDEAPPADVKAFVADQKINYAVAMTNPAIEKIFKGVSALPTTFVIDRDGRIQQRHVGMLNAETAELETQFLSGMKANLRVERVDDPQQAMLKNAAQAKEIPGVDLSKMSPAVRTEAIKALNAENCTCGCELTLAACRINDPSCEISLPIARKLADKVAKTSAN